MFTKIKSFFTPPIFEDQDKTRMARNSFIFGILGATSSLCMTILFWLISPSSVFRNIVITLTTFLAFIELALLHKGYVRLTIIVQSAIIWGGVVLAAFSSDGLHSVGFIGGTIAAMLVMGIAMEWRLSAAFLFLSIVAAGVLAWVEVQGYIDPSRIIDSPFLSVAVYAIFMFILTGLLHLNYQSVTRALDQAHAEINERKRVEEELRQLNEDLDRRVLLRTAQLEAANNELESFSYSISHDLRAPLRAIIGYTQVLQEDCPDSLGTDEQVILDKVIARGKRMNELIDALLSLSHLNQTALNLRQVNVNDIVQRVIESCALDTDGRDIEWIIADMAPTRADPVLLQQVYANLIGNAIKYTSHREQARIEIGCQSVNDERVYVVKDNGSGFDMRYSERLFNAFQRMHREDEFPGIGIGLATVRRIIQHHHGRIWAEAEPDKGAAFYFTIGTERTEMIA